MYVYVRMQTGWRTDRMDRFKCERRLAHAPARIGYGRAQHPYAQHTHPASSAGVPARLSACTGRACVTERVLHCRDEHACMTFAALCDVLAAILPPSTSCTRVAVHALHHCDQHTHTHTLRGKARSLVRALLCGHALIACFAMHEAFCRGAPLHALSAHASCHAPSA